MKLKIFFKFKVEMVILDCLLFMVCWEEEIDRDYSFVYNFMLFFLNVELMVVR